jgi:hypothetical protein
MAANKPRIGSVKIRPNVGLYNLFPSLRYTAWVALGEMVDNSIQSYLQNKERLLEIEGKDYKLQVDIDIVRGDDPQITLIDNAAGIYTADFERAFTPAAPPLDKTGISQYGIGMKSSACWYSKNFTVRTKALDEPVIRIVNFDIPHIVANDTEDLDIQEEENLNPKLHGTRITLRNLNQPAPSAGSASRLRSYLRSMYRDFLRTGELVLTIDGERQEPITYSWLSAPYWPTDNGPVDENTVYEWKKEFEIELNESHNPKNENDPAPVIRGFVGILDKGDTKKAGFSLLWRRKVVQGAGNFADSPDDLYRPSIIFGGSNSYERQRIVGELDVSELKVTSFKDSIIWGEGQEEEALKKIKKVLNADPNPLIKMARNFRANDNSRTARVKVQGTLEDVVDATTRALVDSNASEVLGDDFENVDRSEIPEPPRDSDVQVIQRHMRLIPQFKTDIILEVKDQSDDLSWLRVRPEDNKWIVTLNRDHPFMQSFTIADPDSLEPVLRIALAIGIAEIQGLSSGFEKAGTLRLAINDILRYYLSSRSDLTLEEEEND